MANFDDFDLDIQKVGFEFSNILSIPSLTTPNDPGSAKPNCVTMVGCGGGSGFNFCLPAEMTFNV